MISNFKIKKNTVGGAHKILNFLQIIKVYNKIIHQNIKKLIKILNKMSINLVFKI